MSGKSVVILRPQDDSAELSAAVAAQGFSPLVEPVLDIDYIDAGMPPVYGNTPLVFTSANGIKAFARRSALRSNPVYTVGRNTADEARQSGFTQIETAAGTADDLVDILSKSGGQNGEEFLYIRGEDVSKDLKSILASSGVRMRELTVYRSVPAENLSLALLRALDKGDVAAVMVFSAKGGTVFSGLVEQYGRRSRMRTTKALCISESVLQSVSVLPFGGSGVAETPDRYGMIKLLEQLKD